MSATERSDPAHQHSPRQGAGEGRLLLAFVLTAGFMVAEVVGGLFSQSLALLADAGHMMTDSFALALAWTAAFLARQPANPKHSYGFQRVEVLAATVNAILLSGIALLIM